MNGKRNSDEKNLHAGHRERVRENVINNGFSQLEDHRLLELLLFYSIPRGDTNEIAHTLLKEFGSLGGVISAPKEELVKICGVGENTAVFLASLSELLKRVSNGSVTKKRYYTGPGSLFEPAKALFVNDSSEKIYIMCFDKAMRLLRTFFISEGDFCSVDTNIRKITESVFFSNAAFVAIVHNHPFGEAVPSLSDIDATRSIAVILRRFGVALCDHIIVGENGSCYSFAEDKEYSKLLM